MAKILFVQRLGCDYLGIMSISAVLKKAGHQCDVFIYSIEKDIKNKVKKFKPDVVGIPITAGELRDSISIFKVLKNEFKVITVAGGIHATICPEIIAYEGIDIVCRGEGEYPLLELLNNLDNGEDFTNIDNLYVKQNGNIFKNPLRPLIQDLGILPHLDRQLYYKYGFIRDNPVSNFIFIRGCPYKCSYCHNHLVRDIYRGKGSYIRIKDSRLAIEEIKEALSNHKTRLVRFWDDTFTINRQWLEDFLRQYKTEIGLPFYCTVDIKRVDEDLIRQLKESGCFALEFGIESGNASLRKKILNKNVTDEEILRGARLIRDYKINIITQNMFCLPNETFEDGLKTIEMNQKVKPLFAFSTIFQPYPKLELTNYIIKNGLLDEKYVQLSSNLSYFDSSPLKLKDAKRLESLQRIFILAVALSLPKPFIKLLVKLPVKRLLFIIHIILNGIFYKRAHRLTISDLIIRGWHLFKGYFFRLVDV